VKELNPSVSYVSPAHVANTIETVMLWKTHGKAQSQSVMAMCAQHIFWLTKIYNNILPAFCL